MKVNKMREDIEILKELLGEVIKRKEIKRQRSFFDNRNPFKHQILHKMPFGLIAVGNPHRGGRKYRKGPYNKSRECARRVRQQRRPAREALAA